MKFIIFNPTATQKWFQPMALALANVLHAKIVHLFSCKKKCNKQKSKCVWILFGAHIENYNFDFLHHFYVIVNYEQCSSSYVQNAMYHQRMKMALELWDYSPCNLLFWKKLFPLLKMRWVPFGYYYVPSLSKMNTVQVFSGSTMKSTFDILFYG